MVSPPGSVGSPPSPGGRAVLLIGGGGWTGTAIAEELVRRDIPVRRAGHALFDALSDPTTADELTDELLARGAVRAVVNCVRPHDNPAAHYSYIESSRRLASGCLDESVTYIHVGSAAEYGAPTTDRIAETHPCAPTSSYGKVKLAASLAVMDYGAIVVRPFNIMGPAQPPHTIVGEWVAQLREGMEEGRAATLRVRRPDYVRDFVTLDFLSKVISHVALAPPDVPAVNVCSGRGTSFEEVAISLVRHAGVPVEFEFGEVPNVPCGVLPGMNRIVGDPGLLESMGYAFSESLDALTRQALSHS